jgi:hypothetical protein
MSHEQYPFDEIKPQGQASLARQLLGLLILLWISLIGYQTFQAYSHPYEYAKEVYTNAELAYKLFPEGQDFYKTAVEKAIALYKLKTKLIESGYSFLDILNQALNGNKLALNFLLNLLEASLAKWILFLGILIGIVQKTLVLFSALLLAVVGFVLWKRLKLIDWFLINLKAWSLAKVKSKDILNVLKVLIANPRPASIAHHKNYEGGLLEHSLAVADKALELGKDKNLPPKELYLAGLLHDIGKLKLYTKQGNSWIHTGTSQTVANKMVQNELAQKFGISVPTNPEVWKIVKQADQEITYREIWELFKEKEENIRKLVKKLIKQCQPLYSEELKAVIVKAVCLNEKVLEELKSLFPDLHFEQFYPNDLPPITWINPYRGLIYLKVEDKIADKLDLFDVKADGKILKGVYLFKADLFNEEELKSFRPTKNVEVIER